MEYNKIEILLIKEATVEATDAHVFELDDLQLALVGGGIGETVAQ